MRRLQEAALAAAVVAACAGLWVLKPGARREVRSVSPRGRNMPDASAGAGPSGRRVAKATEASGLRGGRVRTVPAAFASEEAERTRLRAQLLALAAAQRAGDEARAERLLAAFRGMEAQEAERLVELLAAFEDSGSIELAIRLVRALLPAWRARYGERPAALLVGPLVEAGLRKEGGDDVCREALGLLADSDTQAFEQRALRVARRRDAGWGLVQGLVANLERLRPETATAVLVSLASAQLASALSAGRPEGTDATRRRELALAAAGSVLRPLDRPALLGLLTDPSLDVEGRSFLAAVASAEGRLRRLDSDPGLVALAGELKAGVLGHTEAPTAEASGADLTPSGPPPASELRLRALAGLPPELASRALADVVASGVSPEVLHLSAGLLGALPGGDAAESALARARRRSTAPLGRVELAAAVLRMDGAPAAARREALSLLETERRFGSEEVRQRVQALLALAGASEFVHAPPGR
ncbi:MAG: hypothetical protein D6731_15765 [Planctomycetota bacterium]|nr:MAG: hypothetical protein D6731_15765 [Planctomycetota bacterium]